MKVINKDFTIYPKWLCILKENFSKIKPCCTKMLTKSSQLGFT